MLTWFAIVFAISAYIAAVHLCRKIMCWRYGSSLNWPKTLGSLKQAAVCKAFLAKNGIKSKYPVLLTLKYQIEIWQGRRCVLLCFGSNTFPLTRILFQDLSQFRDQRFPDGNCSVVVFFQDISNPMAFDWSREFDVAILHPAQMGELVRLIKSPSGNLSASIFEISAAVAASKARSSAEVTNTLFEQTA